MMNEKAVQFVTILTRGQGVSSVCIEPHTPVPCLDVSPPPPHQPILHYYGNWQVLLLVYDFTCATDTAVLDKGL